jgi:hypothetical protein
VQIEGEERQDGEAAAHRVLVGLRLHHVLYALSLAGEPILQPPDEEGVTHYGVPSAPKRRNREITWRFGGIG